MNKENLVGEIWFLFQQGRMLIGLITYAGVLFLIVEKLHKFGILPNIQKSYLVVVSLGFVATLLLGYLIDKLGFIEQRKRSGANRNPILTEILKEVKNE